MSDTSLSRRWRSGQRSVDRYSEVSALDWGAAESLAGSLGGWLEVAGDLPPVSAALLLASSAEFAPAAASSLAASFSGALIAAPPPPAASMSTREPPEAPIRDAAMHRPIQTIAAYAVTFVKTSPALAPKALEPPMPPRAPANPPPRPRCTKISKIMKIAISASNRPINDCPIAANIGRITLSAPSNTLFHSIKLLQPELGGRSSRAGRGNRQEIAGLQASPADQRAVDVRLTEQLRGIVGLNAAAVQQPDDLGHVGIVAVGD